MAQSIMIFQMAWVQLHKSMVQSMMANGAMGCVMGMALRATIRRGTYISVNGTMMNGKGKEFYYSVKQEIDMRDNSNAVLPTALANITLLMV